DRLFSWPFLFVMLSGLAYFIGVGAMMPTLPRFVEDELGGEGFQVGLSVGAFAVSAALLRPWIGRVGDVRGRRILIVAGAAVAGVSMIAYGAVDSLVLLIGLRLVTGAGEAAFFTGLVTVNQDLAPDNRRGEAASYFSVSLYGGLAFGPPLGEELLDATSFGVVFLVFGGTCLLGAAVGLLVPKGKTLAEPVARKMLHPVALWPGIVIALGLVPITAYAAFLPVYADSVGFDNVGRVLLLYGGLVLVIRIVAARVPDALGWRRTSVVALSGAAAGVGMIGLWGTAAAVWVGTVVLALGMSLLYPALMAAVMGATDESERSHAVGTFTLFLDISMGLGAALVGVVISLTNQRSGFVVAGLCAVGGLVALALLRNRIGQPATAVSPSGTSIAAEPTS
ncbi:MAG: MFS transporter, partial [Acidimicrobiia bacterium]